MSGPKLPPSFALPRPTQTPTGQTHVSPNPDSFLATFHTGLPHPHFLPSAHGRTAIYRLPAPANPTTQQPTRPILLIHGLNTPALGLLPLARALQARHPSAPIALYDLWGHGLSSTPLVPHTPALFHAQLLHVLGFLRWPAAHLVGYSFGGATAASFAVYHPWNVLSVALLAPAGLMVWERDVPAEARALVDVREREAEAKGAVLDWLEGGPLVVPDGWEERVGKGEIVAEALRAWEVREHPGYEVSVLSVVRDGGIVGREERFMELAGLEVRKCVVLGEVDDVCDEKLIRGLGFDDVTVLKGAGHGFVRDRVEETAGIVSRFWSEV